MSTAIWFLLTLAILVFWALGAYNRIIRLRGVVSSALQALLTQWQMQAQTVDARLEQYSAGQETESQWAMLDEGALRWRPLTLAGRQFLACISVLQQQAQALTSADDVAAVWAARNIFESSWQRLLAEQDDLAGAPIPPDLQIAWAQHEPSINDRRNAYNASALAYHQAIEQFPASLVAWVFAFRRTGQLA